MPFGNEGMLHLSGNSDTSLDFGQFVNKQVIHHLGNCQITVAFLVVKVRLSPSTMISLQPW